MLPRPLANAIIILVALVFAINFGAQFVIEGYEPDTAIYGVFGVVAGAAFAQRQGKDRDGGGGPA